MENLRWILLIAGIIFVIVVYAVSRQRRRDREQQQLPLQDELPAFSATDDLDSVDEGVGKVRVVARFEEGEAPDTAATAAMAQPAAQAEAASTAANTAPVGSASRQPRHDMPDDVFTLFIIAPSAQERFTGEQINSAARASSLVFGEMNIFHRLDGEDRIQYSLANMLKPGSFDPDRLFDTETRGITLFMQASLVEDAQAVLDDMLQTAYQIAEMLGGQLCNASREPLTEQDTRQYRERIASLTESA